MNFALALTQNKVPGLKVDTSRFEKMGQPAAIAKGVLFTESTPETKAAISNSLVANKAAANNGKEAAKVAGLVIGGPEFQRR
jgi:hypothetical protein